MKNFLILLFLSAFLSSCAMFDEVSAFTVDAVKIAQSVRYVEKNLGTTLQDIYTAEFYSADEEAAIDQLSFEIDALLVEVKKIIGPGLDVETLVAVSQIDQLILTSRNIYIEMYDIVSSHFQDFSPETQEMLTTLDENLVAMDQTWRMMVENSESGDITPILKTMLYATKTAASILSSRSS